MCRRFDAGRCFFLTFLFKLKNVCIFSYFCVLLLTERGDFGHLQTFRDDYYIRVCCALNIYFPFPSSLYYLISAHGKFFFFFYFLPSIFKILFFSSCFFLFFCFFVLLVSAFRITASPPPSHLPFFLLLYYLTSYFK